MSNWQTNIAGLRPILLEDGKKSICQATVVVAGASLDTALGSLQSFGCFCLQLARVSQDLQQLGYSGHRAWVAISCLKHQKTHHHSSHVCKCSLASFGPSFNPPPLAKPPAVTKAAKMLAKLLAEACRRLLTSINKQDSHGFWARWWKIAI